MNKLFKPNLFTKDIHRRKISLLSAIFIFITLFVLPVIYSDKIVDPVLIPRFLFLSIALIAYVLILSLFKSFRDYIITVFRKKIFVIYIIYFFITIISVSKAHLPTEGLFETLKVFFFLVYMIIGTFFIIYDKDQTIRNILKVGLLISFIINIIVIEDIVHALSIGKWWNYSEHIKGIMANKNQLSIFLFLLLPINIYSLKKFSKKLRLLCFLNIILIIIEILILRTRSVWLGLFITSIIFLIQIGINYGIKNFFLNKNNMSHLYLKTGISILIILSLGYILNTSKVKKYINYSINTKIDIENPRVKIWKSTYDMAKENFFLGVGPGNWKVEYPKYHSQQKNNKYKNWRRPHNDFLWIYSEKGIFAILSYLLFSLLFILHCFHLIKVKNKYRFLIILISSFYIGYLCISCLSFPYERISNQTYIFMFFYMIIGLHILEYKKSKIKPNKKWISFLFLTVTTVILAFSFYYGIIVYRMEFYINKTKKAKNNSNWKECINYSKKAYHPLTKLSPDSAPIHWYMGLSYNKVDNFKKSRKCFHKAYKFQPYHPYVILYHAELELYFNNINKAIELLHKSLKIFPNHQEALFNISVAYYQKEKYRKAFHYLNKIPSEEIDPAIKKYNSKLLKMME